VLRMPAPHRVDSDTLMDDRPHGFGRMRSRHDLSAAKGRRVALVTSTYDAKALNPSRRQRSGAVGKPGRQGKWEVHHDPYDVSRIWVRNHWDGGWLTATWTHLHTLPVPFGELAWRHSMLQLGQRGQDAVTASGPVSPSWGPRSDG
jgi:hypothetical protein